MVSELKSNDKYSLLSACNALSKMQSTSRIKRFNELFSGLEDCDVDEQKQMIEEMNEIIDEMNKKEFESVFTTRMFDKIYKMIEEKKMSLKDSLLLLKHMGYCNVLKNMWSSGFNDSEMRRRFEQMIFEEEKKKEEKNKGLLINLCECYIFQSCSFTPELLSICLSCILEAASKKEESEENQKEVEIALLALSRISQDFEMKQELYLKEITEIIKHQQKHRNLTKLANHSAWEFLINRFYTNKLLEDTVVNELHFSREAARELDVLTRNVDWKKKEEEMNKEEAKEEFTLVRWLQTIVVYFCLCHLRNEENVGLLKNIVQVHRAAKGDNHRGIRSQCVCSLRNAAENRNVKVEDLLKGGAVDAILERIRRRTLIDVIVYKCLQFFTIASNRLKEEDDDAKEKVKRKSSKMEIFEKLEEEGYEDIITSFYETLNIFNKRHYHTLLLKFSDYFVNV